MLRGRTSLKGGTPLFLLKIAAGARVAAADPLLLLMPPLLLLLLLMLFFIFFCHCHPKHLRPHHALHQLPRRHGGLGGHAGPLAAAPRCAACGATLLLAAPLCCLRRTLCCCSTAAFAAAGIHPSLTLPHQVPLPLLSTSRRWHGGLGSLDSGRPSSCPPPRSCASGGLLDVLYPGGWGHG